jgi:multidrug efflux pump subunit AcrB
MKRVAFLLISALLASALGGGCATQAMPVIAVTTDISGASAEIVESQVTLPLEQVLQRVPGARLVRSQSRSGRSVIEFQVERALACEAVSRLELALAGIRTTLPATLAAPAMSVRPAFECR